MLSMLVGPQSHEDGFMGDREIRDELLTLLIAGHETTATALAWTFERLLRHPEALSRLRRAELEAAAATPTPTPSCGRRCVSGRFCRSPRAS